MGQSPVISSESQTVSDETTILTKRELSLSSAGHMIRRYPIPFFAILGLLVGIILQLPLSQPNIGSLAWYVTLVVGGIPIVWKTLRGMLHKQFAADVVAMLAIIAAILLDQAFAGVIVVLMQSGGEAIEDYGLRRASSSLDALLARAPRLARKKKTGGSIETISRSEE